MKTVKVTKNGETKTVESGSLHIWQARGWVEAKETTYKPSATTSSYSYDKTSR